MTQKNNVPLGIAIMIVTTIVFSIQDGLSRHLAGEYNVLMIVMIRYWFFGAFVLTVAKRNAGSIVAAARTSQPLIQIIRGLLLCLEICLMVVAYTVLGLIETHAVFICYPLLVAALSGPVLGEHVGWRRWAAIAVGFMGVMIILKPDTSVFDIRALLPFVSALMFAVYGLLTRYVGRTDSTATSFFWTGVVGCIVLTVVGISSWEPMATIDWFWMGCLCVTGITGHWLLIRCYEVAEASAVQPFAFFQLGFVALIGMTVFGETISLNVAMGGTIIVAAGLFTFWRERLQG